LHTYLTIGHVLTKDGHTTTDRLLNRVNAVLKAVVETNFGARSLQSVAALYETIGSTQSAIVDESVQNVALIYLARSLAVVLEESILKIGRGMEEKDNKEEIVGKEEEDENIWSAPSSYDRSRDCSSSVTFTRGAAAAAFAAASTGPEEAAAGLCAARSSLSSPACSREGRYWQPRIRPPEMLDYSAEAIRGRVNIFRIPSMVSKRQLVDFLLPIACPSELSYPTTGEGMDRHRGFALARFESNELADEVVRRLNGVMLSGRSIGAKRAEFWFKRDQPAPTPLLSLSNTVDSDCDID
ncbi:hypothetical protein PFISCL1PPCAC_21245, partial [Pristionchus fissidentatus]